MSPPADDRDALASLLTRTAGGDQRAFSDLYQRSADRLYGVCLRMLQNRSEAEEVL
jgi:RNA polymerase sigma-70 factor (ECF subfamily)